MQAVEFNSTPHDNVVDLPAELRAWNGRPVRVILLTDEASAEPTASPVLKAVSLKTCGFKFDREEADAR